MLAGSSIIKSALFDQTWHAYRDGKRIGVSDLKIGPHSIDVSLGNKFITPTDDNDHTDDLETMLAERIIDPYVVEQVGIKWVESTAESIILYPGQFVLAYVRERFDSSRSVHTTGHRLNEDLMHFTQCYDGRSTMGRLGIMSHVTAGYGDLGFRSNFTLELHNVNPNAAVKLYAGMRIGQISFHAIACIEEEPSMYQGSYTEQHDRPIGPSLGWQKFVQPGEGPRDMVSKGAQ